MRYGLAEISGSPAPEPVLTLAEAKTHLRVDITADDTLIQALILAAARHAEQYARRVFVSRQFVMTLEDFPRATWLDGTAAQDGDVWPPRFGCLSRSDRFPDAIVLPLAPLVSVDSIQYFSTTLTGSPESPVLQTINDAQADTITQPPRILPRYGTCWPDVARMPQAVTVTFTAGYGTPSDVPEDIKAAVKLILGSLYEHREDEAPMPVVSIPRGAAALLSPYRVFPL